MYAFVAVCAGTIKCSASGDYVQRSDERNEREMAEDSVRTY